ncbi:MAG: protein kinase [Tepidiformaceae bacterium]
MNASDLIDQRYRLERLLGTGGMAEVWLAEDQRLKRWVAIKLLRQDGGDADAAGREAQMVAQLHHPNIVSVYDVGDHDGHSYIVMEYVHGYSIGQLLQTQGRFHESEAIRYGVQVATALDHANQRGLIHRDVKPANILVDEKGVAKLADFGVAGVMNQTLAPGQADEILGSIAYLPPEVIQGAEPDARGDVYALGMTLYEMVAGRLPFAGTTSAAIASQRLAGAAPPLRTLARGASPEFEAVLARALSLSPGDRFQSGGQFASALRSVPPPRTGHTPPIIAPPGRAPRSLESQTGWRTQQSPARGAPARRNGAPTRRSSRAAGPMIATVAGLILLAVAIGGVVALILSQQDEGGGLAPATATRPAPTVDATSEPSKAATPRPTNEPTLTPTPAVSPTVVVSPTAGNPTAAATATKPPVTAAPTQPAATPTATPKPPTPAATP